ncbi:methionine/alanine import family NSS transporter small subunit [Micrococcus sp.]|uniref:methionine/alanine import family NSS transporter small subunit n=1 Tax=Micrococcus sp. TaxID=1271 RepID=UPI0026DB91F6|nr:methionine/alanine import family NSS transporter small subunit [Micrococcus sp.]MDO4238958.1 methionine/alanine import family NSS transporter small subunit [Micrococcus sp.]
MSPLAITMMTIAIVLVWGGLALSAVHLLKHPDETSGELGDRRRAADGVRADTSVR